MSAISANAFIPACAQILLIICYRYEIAVFSKSALISLFLASMWEVFFCSSWSCNLACSSFILLSFTPILCAQSAVLCNGDYLQSNGRASDEQALGIGWTSLGHQVNKPWASSEQALGISCQNGLTYLPTKILKKYRKLFIFVSFIFLFPSFPHFLGQKGHKKWGNEIWHYAQEYFKSIWIQHTTER